MDTGEEAAAAVARWGDMDADCLVEIFRRLPLDDVAAAAPLVCRSWRAAARDASLWRALDLRGGGAAARFMPWSPLAAAFAARYGVRRFTFAGYLRLCVARAAAAAELALRRCSRARPGPRVAPVHGAEEVALRRCPPPTTRGCPASSRGGAASSTWSSSTGRRRSRRRRRASAPVAQASPASRWPAPSATWTPRPWRRRCRASSASASTAATCQGTSSSPSSMAASSWSRWARSTAWGSTRETRRWRGRPPWSGGSRLEGRDWSTSLTSVTWTAWMMTRRPTWTSCDLAVCVASLPGCKNLLWHFGCCGWVHLKRRNSTWFGFSKIHAFQIDCNL